MVYWVCAADPAKTTAYYIIVCSAYDGNPKILCGFGGKRRWETRCQEEEAVEVVEVVEEADKKDGNMSPRKILSRARSATAARPAAADRRCCPEASGILLLRASVALC